jgi:hypothetical protein
MFYSKYSNFVIFPNCVNSNDSFAADLVGNVLVLKHNGNVMQINLDDLSPCSSTQVVSWAEGDKVIYHYREFLEEVGLKPREFLWMFNLHGWAQIDKTSRGVFVKLFCPKGKTNPESEYTDWAKYPHSHDLHATDRANSWSFTIDSCELTNNKLKIIGELWKSPLWANETIYLNYGNNAFPLKEGRNEIITAYLLGEWIYTGNRFSHYPGRRVNVTEVLREGRCN